MASGERGVGHLVVQPDKRFNGVKIFAATMHQQRDQLGETVTAWIAANPTKKVTEFVVTQSSDDEFHMVAISVFYVEPATTRART
jgi:hypothetical protein